MTRRSPNVLSVGDRVLYRWAGRDYPVVVRGFEGNYVRVEADDPYSSTLLTHFTELASRPT